MHRAILQRGRDAVKQTPPPPMAEQSESLISIPSATSKTPLTNTSRRLGLSKLLPTKAMHSLACSPRPIHRVGMSVCSAVCCLVSRQKHPVLVSDHPWKTKTNPQGKHLVGADGSTWWLSLEAGQQELSVRNKSGNRNRSGSQSVTWRPDGNLLGHFRDLHLLLVPDSR
jgi:hypothetical protein